MNKKKNRSLAVIVLLLGLGLGLLYNVKENGKALEVTSLEKPAPGEKAGSFDLILNAGDELLDYEYEVNVEDRKLNEKEQKEKLDEALLIWRKELLAENASQNYVDKSLKPFDELCDGLVNVRLSFDYTLIAPGGSINFDKVSESGTLTEIKASLKCGEKEAFDNMYVVLYPPRLTRTEEILSAVKESINAENSGTSEEFTLPLEAAGVELRWSRKKNNTGIFIMMLGIVAAAGILYGSAFDEKKEREKRNKALEREFILLLRQLSVLTRAGMTVMAAFDRIADSYLKRKKSGFLKNQVLVYEEIIIILRRVKDGLGESEAYKSFGEQCGIPCYRKLSTLLIQNYKKGSRNLGTLLEALLEEEYTKQKTDIKKRGEELSTRLLLPMMIMLVLVMVIVTVPAMGSFNL
ncbi:MAG: type II secretion system F family protein [Lachnospiraceae bacterium]|nr:type II secretion system F family protein [Lachnospiraceae bacterium]